ncbi:MAG: vitamin K epoxide reductase family protein [Gammaproteobacteria bacterium]
MAKKKKRDRKRKPSAPAQTTTRPANAAPDWPMALLAGAGLVLTGVLIWSASSAGHLPYCSEGSACDVVQSSAWSRFLGVPLTMWGFANYVVIGLVAVIPARAEQRWRWTALLTATGFGISIYLTAISVVVIEAVCGYCLASLAVMASAFGLSFRTVNVSRRAAWRGAGVAFAILVSLTMHLDARGMLDGSGGEVDPYLRELAEHLERSGFKFYGASWCPVCREQKNLFGNAARYLPYVECSPHGRNGPRATVCETEEINNYPTWTVDGRRIEKLLVIERLAAYSGFPKRGGEISTDE